MKYTSTRDSQLSVRFDEAFLSGLAPDGGLYVPCQWPSFSAEQWRALRGQPYHDIAFAILQPFVEGALDDDELRKILHKAYVGKFHHPAIAPLTQLDNNVWLLELFHGPTMAFKDFGLQFLGQTFAHLLQRDDRQINIIGATSGDTGSAAIAGCRGLAGINIFILHPHERISPIQRRQMTCVADQNVFNLAIEGNFDDCQAHVKAMFGDLDFRATHGLSAVNSINWGRIAAQIVYYAYAAMALGGPDREVDFVIPSANFGNIFAGYCLQKMGLPIGKFVLATNQNDILHRFIDQNDMTNKPVVASIAPSMDIQTSSNFERLLWSYGDQDDRMIRQAFAQSRETGDLQVAKSVWQSMRAGFSSSRIDDDEMRAEIKDVYEKCGIIIDPHTATGTHIARRMNAKNPLVSLATAHPAKFPDAVEQAINITPEIPAHQTASLSGEERFAVLPNDLAAIKSYIAARALPIKT